MIAQSIIEQAGKKRRSGDWYVNALEQALSSIQDPDISESDTGGVAVGDLIFFQYGAKYPEKYEFWDLQPLSYVIEFYPDGFLGDYRDAVARSLINSKGGVTVPKNSIHRYLFSGMGSLYKIPTSEDWGDIALLPTEKFIDNRGMKYPKHRAYSWSK